MARITRGKTSSLAEEKVNGVEEAKKFIRWKRDQDGLEIKFIDPLIGKGVFAKQDFKKGDFILEYNGELISKKEALRRLEEYPDGIGSFIYFFKSKENRTICVDGTFSKKMGKMVNDGIGKDQNCAMRLLEVDGKPFLAMFAIKDIKAGDEIKYDYGVKDLPWRKNRTVDRKKNVSNDAGELKKIEDLRLGETLQKQQLSRPCFVKLKRMCDKQLRDSKFYVAKSKDKKISKIPMEDKEDQEEMLVDVPNSDKILPRNALERIQKIKYGCTEYIDRFKDVKDSKDDKECRLLEETLTRCLEDLDSVEVGNCDLARQQRKQTVDEIQSVLDNHVMDPGKSNDVKIHKEVVIEGVRGTSNSGDIAIDNIILKSGDDCSALTGAPGSTTAGPPTACNFEDPLTKCLYTQDKSDDFDWARKSGSTATSNTGPDSDDTYETKADQNVLKKNRTCARNFITQIWNRRLNWNGGYIGPYRITANSLLSLRDELTDEILDGYFHTLTENRNIYHINSILMTSIFYDKPELHGYLLQLVISDYDLIIGAINEGESHWTLTIIDPKKKEILYFNPLGETRLSANQLLQNWYCFLNGRQQFGYEKPEMWTIKTMLHSKQQDGISCGVYVLKIAECFINEENLHFTMDSKELQEYRLQIGVKLLLNIGNKDTDLNFVAEEVSGALDTILEQKEFEISDDTNSDKQLDVISEETKSDYVEKDLPVYYMAEPIPVEKNLPVYYTAEPILEASEYNLHQHGAEIIGEFDLGDILQDKQLTVVGRDDLKYVMSYLESQGETLIEKSNLMSDINEPLAVDSVHNMDTDTDPDSDMIGNNKSKDLPQQDLYTFMESSTQSHTETSLQRSTRVDKQKEPKNDNVSGGKKCVRPYRPCLFCGQLKSRLTEHIKAKHSDEDKVKEILLLPKDLQNKAFNDLKKQGIFKANQEVLKDKLDQSKLHRERKQGKDDVKICSFCKGFFSTKAFYKHKKSCSASGAEGTRMKPTALSLFLVSPDPEFEEAYKKDILDSFRDTDYGNLIRSDNWIKTYGSILYQNIEGSVKKIEKRLSLTSKLRRLAHLFLEFRNIAKKLKSQTSFECCSQMFDRTLIPLMQQAIAKLTIEEETGKIKNGLKVSLRYLLADVCNIMQAHYLILMEDNKAEEIHKFMHILKTIFPSFFKEAEETIVTKRQAELRIPIKLPAREDIINLRNFNKKIIQNLSSDKQSKLSSNDFCRLRDALVCRLTLYNGRRGGETCRMRLTELNDALEDKWVDKRKIHEFSEIDEILLRESKIAYIRASKLARLVPVIIPNDCWQALMLLSRADTRQDAGVNPNNEFLFPNTQNSMNHVIGFDSIARMCEEAGLEKHLNATSMRHYVATEYALEDASKADRELFYKHMGHSETINENVYQCPPALRELKTVGKILKQFDNTSSQNIGQLSETQSDCLGQEPTENEEFISNFVPEISLYELIDESKVIEEGDVTVKPEQLKASKDLLLNFRVQNAVKQYFSSDAWLVVENSLKMIEGTCRNVEPETTKQKNTVKEKRRQCKKSTIYEDSNNESDYVPSEEGSISENDSFIDMEIDTKKEEIQWKDAQKSRKRRHTWLPEEDEAITDYFSEEIGDISQKGNKGALHVDKKIKQFIQKNPALLNDCEYADKKKKIRVKIINLRRQTRERYQRNLNYMS